MINKINIAENRPAKSAVTFTANPKIARHQMYTVTDTFVRIFEEKTTKPFIETLATVLRRSPDEIKNIFKIADADGLDHEYTILKATATKIKELKELNPKIGKDLPKSLNKDFKTFFSEFLLEKGFVNKKNVFDKLPAKYMVMKQEAGFADIDLMKDADKVIFKQPSELSSASSKTTLAIGDGKVKKTGPKNLHIKKEKVKIIDGNMKSKKAIYDNDINIPGDISSDRHIILTGVNKIGGNAMAPEAIEIENPKIVGDLIADGFDVEGTVETGIIKLDGVNATIEGNILAGRQIEINSQILTTGKSVTSKLDSVTLNGKEAYIGEDLTSKTAIDSAANTFIKGNVRSKESYAKFVGKRTFVGGNFDTETLIEGHNLTVKGKTTCHKGDIICTGKSRFFNDISCKKFKPSFNTLVYGEIHGSAPFYFPIQNAVGKFLIEINKLFVKNEKELNGVRTLG